MYVCNGGGGGHRLTTSSVPPSLPPSLPPSHPPSLPPTSLRPQGPSTHFLHVQHEFTVHDKAGGHEHVDDYEEEVDDEDHQLGGREGGREGE